jgi:PTS system nitrogen regulatory IIA component
MKISDFLSQANVIETLAGTTMPDILDELARPVAASTGIPTDKLVAPLLARERLGATAIGDGVALPHGKIAGLFELRAAFGRSRAGVAFGAGDGPTHFFFALFVPETRPGSQLHALARIAGVMKSQALRELLLEAASAEDIYQLLLDEDAGTVRRT